MGQDSVRTDFEDLDRRFGDRDLGIYRKPEEFCHTTDLELVLPRCDAIGVLVWWCTLVGSTSRQSVAEIFPICGGGELTR